VSTDPTGIEGDHLARAYALNKLAESGEGEALARRHAEYYRDLLELAA
jgi:predicted ATPase